MKFIRETLDNGLEIVAECNPAAYSTAVGFFVQAGSRDEADAVAGVSHFLEHMAFKGTPRRTADDVNRRFDEIGAHYNACTSEESTIFYAAVLPEYQDAAVELLGDILRPSLRTEDFDTEKQVILEEIRMYEDLPPFGADDKCRAAYFGAHPLGRSVLGTIESITHLTAEAMRAYHASRYTPGNVTLVSTGRVDFDALVRAARRVCGHWEPRASRRARADAVPCRRFEVLRKPGATQQYAVELAPGPGAKLDDRYAAKLLATVLGDDTGSRLYWELVEPGLAENASLTHCEFEDAGAMMTYLCCEPDDAVENLQRIRDVYRRVRAEGVAPDEIEQAKNKVRSRIVLSSERPRGRLFVVGSDWTYRRAYCSVADDLAAVAQVTPDEIHAVLAHYPLDASATVTIGPLAEVAPPR
ncbi:MAG: insulinase family protein [Pirellulales bacterium]|nr:insulinase family protein [Pirellulales bacterium]